MKPYTVIKPHLKIFPESKNNLKTSEVAWSIHLPNQIQRGTIPQPKININRPHIIEKKSPKKPQPIHILQPAKISSKGFKIGYRKPQPKSNAQIPNNSQIIPGKQEQDLKKRQFMKDNEVLNKDKQNKLAREEPKSDKIVIIRDEQIEQMSKLKIIRFRRALQNFLKIHQGEQCREKVEIEGLEEESIAEQVKEKYKRRLIYQKAGRGLDSIQLKKLYEQLNQQIFPAHKRLLDQHQKLILLDSQLIEEKIKLALLEQSYQQGISHPLHRSLSPEFDKKQLIKQRVIIDEITESIQRKAQIKASRSLNKKIGDGSVFIEQKQLDIIIKEEVQSLSPTLKNILKRRLLTDQINWIQSKQNGLVPPLIAQTQPQIVLIKQEQEFMNIKQRRSQKRNLSRDKKISDVLNKDAEVHVNLDNFKEEQLMGRQQKPLLSRQLCYDKADESTYKHAVHLDLDNVNQQQFMSQNHRLSSKRLVNSEYAQNVTYEDSAVQTSIKVNLDDLKETSLQKSRISLKRSLPKDNNDSSILFKNGYNKANTFHVGVNQQDEKIDIESKQDLKRNIQLSDLSKGNFYFVPPPIKNSPKSNLPKAQNQKSSQKFKHFINLPHSQNSPPKIKSPSHHVHINSLRIEEQKK